MTVIASTWRLLRRLLLALAALAALVLVIAWMSGWFHTKVPPGEAEGGKPDFAGRTWAYAEMLRTTENVDAVGTVEPRRKTVVSSQILATISRITVHASEPVAKGQLLVTLDDRELQAQLREAEAAAAGAQADLVTREHDFQRYKMMYEEKAVTREDYDKFKGAYEVAQAQLRRVQEQVGRTKVMLSYSQVRAPAGGIVANRFADLGDLAAPGKPLLALHDPKDLELHASVREALAGTVRLGAELPVHIDAVSLDLSGRVREIVPQAQEASRSVLVKISLPSDKTSRLYVGMFGRVSLPIGHADRVVVPTVVVQHVGQLELIEVAGPDGGAERRFVRTGRHFGDKVEVLSGLAGGERVALPAPVDSGREK
jgi:membrane fusion protein (multidrug efflux system)